MPTEVFWNKAKPPRSEGEHAAAGWLAMIARQVGLVSVTEDNKREWLWRFAFTQEMRGRKADGEQGGYEDDIGKLDAVLDRFRTATLEGRVADRTRVQFVEEFVQVTVDAVREQTDAVIEERLWEAAA